MTLADLMNATKPKLQPLTVEGLGTVYLKELTVGERLELVEVFADDEKTKGKHLYVMALLYTLCDQDGNRLFTSEDYDKAASMGNEVALKLGREAALFNKLIGDVVETEKKS